MTLRRSAGRCGVRFASILEEHNAPLTESHRASDIHTVDVMVIFALGPWQERLKSEDSVTVQGEMEWNGGQRCEVDSFQRRSRLPPTLGSEARRGSACEAGDLDTVAPL